MEKIKNCLLGCLIAVITLVSITFDSLSAVQESSRTHVAIVVNGNAITNYDIERRTEFLRLQRRNGNLEKIAREELIDEMLRCIELRNRNITVTEDRVNDAFAEFSEHNHMTEIQLAQMLTQEGVTSEHFKSYIKIQIGWWQLVNARFRAESIVSEEEAVQRMLKNGGVKPTINEYRLQQIIFVVPSKNRLALLEERRKEANTFRSQIRGCDNLHMQAKGMIDVTIRDLGRILELQIPSIWEKSVLATPVGKATSVRDTDRGIEFLIVCSIRKVSDDRVARLVYSIENNRFNVQKIAIIEKKYMQELHAKAQIKNL